MLLKNVLSCGLLKKMQGGVTHAVDGYPGPSEAYSRVRRSVCPSKPTPQMDLFEPPAESLLP
jgi:hypothetical protein